MRKMLEDKEIDAVSIASPNHLHSIQGIWTLQAGKHLYVEKPLSHNIFEGQQLVAASQHFSKLIVQAGTQSRSGAGIIAPPSRPSMPAKYGKVKVARAICYKRRKSIGPAKKNALPPTIDNDLWHGPADLQESIRGNEIRQGHRGRQTTAPCTTIGTGSGTTAAATCATRPSTRSISRAGSSAPMRSRPEVVSVGGRFGYVDCAETPNTFISIHNYAAAPPHHRGLRPDLRRQDGRPHEQVRQVLGTEQGPEVGQVARHRHHRRVRERHHRGARLQLGASLRHQGRASS